MKKIENLILLFCFLTIFLCGCETQSASINEQISAKPQPTATATPIAEGDPTNSNKETKSQEFECVRAKPEAIINNSIFPDTTFKLEKNKEFPKQETGFESVKFKNGDKLIIENTGCENYTLIFRFETGRFSNNPDNIRLWYKNAVSLMEQTIKGIREPNLLVRGTKALKSYLKKTKTPQFNEEIDFGGKEIREVVSIAKVEKLSEKNYQVEVSYGVGPL